MLQKISNLMRLQILRYAVNGLVATAVHFAVLQINLNVVGIKLAGVANFIAAFFGIATSFVGSRYFVFQASQNSIWHQLSKFGGLYGAIALFQGGVLYAWTDLHGLDYRSGFVLATVIQVVASYLGNKIWVFQK